MELRTKFRAELTTVGFCAELELFLSRIFLGDELLELSPNGIRCERLWNLCNTRQTENKEIFLVWKRCAVTIDGEANNTGKTDHRPNCRRRMTEEDIVHPGTVRSGNFTISIVPTTIHVERMIITSRDGDTFIDQYRVYHARNDAVARILRTVIPAIVCTRMLYTVNNTAIRCPLYDRLCGDPLFLQSHCVHMQRLGCTPRPLIALDALETPHDETLSVRRIPKHARNPACDVTR